MFKKRHHKEGQIPSFKKFVLYQSEAVWQIHTWLSSEKNTNIIINYEANTSPLNTPSNLASNSSSNSITAKTAIFSPSKKWAVEATKALEKVCNECLRYIVNSRVAPIKIQLDHWLDLNKRVA